METVKLALVQFESALMDVAANVRKGLRFVEQASRQGAGLIVFPELFVTGYNTDVISHRYHELAEDIDGPTVWAFREAAQTHNINIVIPMALKQSEGGTANGAVIIDRSGAIAGTYSKVHLWEDERKYFKPGDICAPYELDFGKLGVLICYDAGFPEAARTLALQGVKLIVTPSAFSLEDKHRWDIYFPARALENTCFVAGINGVGSEGGLRLFGNNKLANPRGDLILNGDLNEEAMQVLEIDLNEAAECSRQIPYLRDLRMDTYGYQA
ncbi:nitrilase-related carbon-nitrogen hydrolase [Paenibacillus riograndensis]|uniref:Nitrilase/cyanide hydratase and apolipoprotein N-acyltransferase n=1 Tax=Paenibacillus riograndensis SBR5 TaxID=1073571 RepID=A0A0E4H641_9BACL|nr:nitrilase-related carbon-nitrogen hydrolase [Paenibacillus riograndensis]CQR51592.1 Nitrilase/cyanide hydratase and apolipoprotein N-acyltransferase [Paenibacillus riograndensis SBR5]